jgi:hypothetical protein
MGNWERSVSFNGAVSYEGDTESVLRKRNDDLRSNGRKTLTGKNRSEEKPLQVPLYTTVTTRTRQGSNIFRRLSHVIVLDRSDGVKMAGIIRWPPTAEVNGA